MSFSHPIPLPRRRHSRSLVDSFFPAALAIVVFAVAGCATSTVRSNASPSAGANLSLLPPTPDPRIGLKPGAFDAPLRGCGA